MVVPVFTHPDCLAHDPGPGHPETPTRLAEVLARLSLEPGARLVEASPGRREALRLVHPEAHLADLEELSRAGGGSVSLDTYTNASSWAAVLGGHRGGTPR
jgi:acetoin utilization deacetylase AcuC-like enzyme